MFEEIVRTAGFNPLKLRHDAKHWQWWLAEYTSPTRTTKEDFLYFDRGARWRDVDAASSYFKFGHGDVILTALVSNGAYSLARNLGKLREKLGIDGAKTVPDFLCTAVGPRLGRLALQETVGVENFVEPLIRYPSDDGLEPGVTRLLKWFHEFESGKPTVGVVLAHGGTGKSTLGRALFERIAGSDQTTAIPLLIRQEQWVGLLSRPWSTLSEVWKEALMEWFPGTVFGPDQLEVFLSQGAIYPIFDGFDELCTILPDVSPTDVLDEMLGIFSEGRILLTSRRRFWEENIPPALQAEVVEIDLFPFTPKQRDLYLQKRYPASQEKQRLAKQILDRISSKTFPSRVEHQRDEESVEFERLDHLPLVVMLVAESADSEDPEFERRYGELLDEDDPLRGVLSAFCTRERTRQKLTLTAAEQLQVLEILATEFSGELGDSAVELALAVVRDGISAAERERFLEHTLLRKEHGRTYFRFPFVEDYLTASVIDRHLEGEEAPTMFANALKRCATGVGTVLDLTADLLIGRGTNPANLSSRIHHLLQEPNLSEQAKSGIVHLSVRLAKRLGQGPRSDATAQLVRLTQGDPVSVDTLRALPVTGTVSQIDFCGVTLTNCTFSAPRCFKWATD